MCLQLDVFTQALAQKSLKGIPGQAETPCINYCEKLSQSESPLIRAASTAFSTLDIVATPRTFSALWCHSYDFVVV